ncbi:MAG: cell division protein ZapA [Clostridia bacterium]|nr:cell division protein ZapA [Clostridia bacterium]
MDSKNVIIYVAGQRYSIRTKDTEEYVISTGEQVDLRIKGIQNDNPRLNRDACAILAALDYCDDMRKLSSRVDILREQVKDYLADSEKLRSEIVSLKRENEKLKEEIRTLKEKQKPQSNVPQQGKSQQASKANSGAKNSGVPYANPQASQRYGVQSFSNTKESKPVTGSAEENYHQFSIFDKEIK